jgi:hypothetical protein
VCQWSLQLAPLAGELRQPANTGSPSVTMTNVPRSYPHRQVNRLVRSGQRAHEFVPFELLGRFSSSQVGRRGSSR